jgi:hypothetical protein
LSSTYALTQDPVFMRVTGEWQLRDDGVVRPIMRAKVLGSAGTLASENFLFDLIIGRHHNDILLLAPRHRYRIDRE